MIQVTLEWGPEMVTSVGALNGRSKIRMGHWTQANQENNKVSAKGTCRAKVIDKLTRTWFIGWQQTEPPHPTASQWNDFNSSYVQDNPSAASRLVLWVGTVIGLICISVAVNFFSLSSKKISKTEFFLCFKDGWRVTQFLQALAVVTRWTSYISQSNTCSSPHALWRCATVNGFH